MTINDLGSVVQISVGIFAIVSTIIFAFLVIKAKLSDDRYFDPVAAALIAGVIGFSLAMSFLILNIPGH